MPKNESLEKQKLIENAYYHCWNLFIESGVCIHDSRECVTKVLQLCWEMKRVSNQCIALHSACIPIFRGNPNSVGSCPSSLSWQHLNLCIQLWVPGLGHPGLKQDRVTHLEWEISQMCALVKERESSNRMMLVWILWTTPFLLWWCCHRVAPGSPVKTLIQRSIAE